MKLYAVLFLFAMFFPLMSTYANGGDGPLPLKVRENKNVMALRADLRMGRVDERTNFALDVLLAVAVRKLKQDGYEFEAAQIQKEWKDSWFGYIMRVRDLGDHAPLSEWLAITYYRIEALLGPDLMAWLHLDDIYVINYAIPVVFRPCNEEWDKLEYQKHFTPLAGVLAYWGTVGPCILLTSGVGTLFCSPAGMAAEWLMVQYVAPGMSDFVYRTACEDVSEVAARYSNLWDELPPSSQTCTGTPH